MECRREEIVNAIKWLLIIIAAGYACNIFGIDTSFFVNRNIYDQQGIRGLVSLYSEQSYIPSALACAGITFYVCTRKKLKSIGIYGISLLSGAGQILLTTAIVTHSYQ